jgi:phosphoglycolate phosphatase-like HAD superfamily hydrolase
MTDKKIALFSLVSTLTDSGPRYAKAYIEACSLYDLTPPSEEDLLDALGEMSLGAIIEKFNPTLPLSLLKKFMTTCNNYCSSMLESEGFVENTFPYVHEILTTLKDDGVTLGLFTGTRISAADQQIKHHRLTEFFNENLIRAKSEDMGEDIKSKDLKSLQVRSLKNEFAKMCGHTDFKMVIIGDSMSDYEVAHENDCVFVAYGHSERQIERMKSEGVQNIITDYRQLRNIVLNLG